MKDSLACLFCFCFFFKLSQILGIICCGKKLLFTRQSPSLGSIIAGFKDTFEILIAMPIFGQELSIYICPSPVKMVDFIHSKWEGCIFINSLIFVVVSRNILYRLNLGKNYPSTKVWSNKKNDRLYQKPHTTIFTDPTSCGKTHLVLDLIEKEYNRHFDYIIIICPTLW